MLPTNPSLTSGKRVRLANGQEGILIHEWPNGDLIVRFEYDTYNIESGYPTSERCKFTLVETK